jgi:DNA polymerase III sliding clamp (beta) subunit (PCNA family)
MLDRTNETTTAAEIVVTAGDLHDALRRVRHAISKEETRYYLNGVYLHHLARENVLRFVAIPPLPPRFRFGGKRCKLPYGDAF